MSSATLGAWGLLGTWISWFVFGAGNPVAGQDLGAILLLLIGNIAFGSAFVIGLFSLARRRAKEELDKYKSNDV